ncbi:hypothetical protein Tco_0594071 [Tanacetum coccineum]
MVWNKKATQARRVEKGESPNAQNHKDKPATNPSKMYSSAPKADDIVLKNSFSQLVENAEVEWGDDQTWGNAKHAVSTINDSDSEEVDEDINLEEPPRQAMSHANKGNSVPHGFAYIDKERITKKRTKNKAKTTKPDTEWKSCKGQSQSKAKDQKSQSQSQLNKLTVKTGAVIEEYYWLQSQPI